MSSAVPVIERRSYPDRVLTDRHDFHQLLLGLSGSVELEVEGRGVRIHPGVLLPIPAGKRHHYLAFLDNDCLTLDLPVDWCEAAGLDLSEGVPRQLVPSLLAAVPPLAAVEPWQWARWLQKALGAGGAPMRPSRLALIRLIAAIEAAPARSWRVREMASQCHLAEAVFARQFRALTGQTPHAWLLARRLERARSLMLRTSLSLTDIAAACGFADAAHFSRSFRQMHGCSPRQWRRAALLYAK